MIGTEARTVSCPYCAELIEVLIDPSISSQQYIEDCRVCCRPITFQVFVEGEDIRVSVWQEDEY